MEKKPTLRLRWLNLDEKDSSRAVVTDIVGSYDGSSESYRVLQQWWEDKYGHGEWIDIEIE